MKNLSILVLLLILLAPQASLGNTWPGPGDEPAYSLLDSVVVTEISVKLPTDPGQLNKTLWKDFAGRDADHAWSSITVPVAADAWTPFRDRLLAKAHDLFPADRSLRRVLIAVMNSEGYSEGNELLLPHAAYRLDHQGGKMWVVVCARGSRIMFGGPDRNPRPARMEHIAIWAIDAETMETVAFSTCR